MEVAAGIGQSTTLWGSFQTRPMMMRPAGGALAYAGVRQARQGSVLGGGGEKGTAWAVGTLAARAGSPGVPRQAWQPLRGLVPEAVALVIAKTGRPMHGETKYPDVLAALDLVLAESSLPCAGACACACVRVHCWYWSGRLVDCTVDWTGLLARLRLARWPGSTGRPRGPSHHPQRRTVVLVDYYARPSSIKRLGGFRDGVLIRVYAIVLSSCFGDPRWTPLREWRGAWKVPRANAVL